jgi:hypothetical protein
MWLHGSFSDLDSDDCDPTLAKFFDEDGALNIHMVKYIASSACPYQFFPKSSTLEIERRFRECTEHVYSDEFWGIFFERD